jgi:hypothetical protein
MKPVPFQKVNLTKLKQLTKQQEKSYELLLTNTQFKAPFSGIITDKKLK